MAEWFVRKITGQDLLDKAMDLAIAEENANMIINALHPELEEISQDQEPIVIRTEGSGLNSGGTAIWVSRRQEDTNITVNGSREVFNFRGIGRLIEAYINCSNSSAFSAELIVDGVKWYSGTYTELLQTSIADSHMGVYSSNDTNEYFINFSDITFMQSLQLIVGANSLTFDVIRINYEELVQ